MKLLKSRLVRLGLVFCLVAGAAGVWALLHPAGFWLQPWRPQAAAVGARFIFGPYPVEPDFRELERRGVTTIISLLDSNLPYEKVLLTQEQALAQQHGMRVLNFPMASILGVSFGRDYLANSKAAAQAANESKGIVYIHCYLGLHRAENVRKILGAYTDTTRYEGNLQSGRSADELALDRANLAFMEGRPDESLQALATMQTKTPAASLLEAWSNYRLGRREAACTQFAAVAGSHPELPDAATGLGYCALSRNELPEAARLFQQSLSARPDDYSAMEGLGHVRYREGRHAEAKALFERVLQHTPEHVEVKAILEQLRTIPAGEQ